MTEQELLTLLDTALRLSIAVLFAASGARKLWRPSEFGRVLEGYGVASVNVRSLAVVVAAAAELAIAILWLVPPLTHAAGAVTIATLMLFTGAMVVARRRGYTGDCGCDGLLTRGRIGTAAYVRNLLLGVAATVATIAASTSLGVPNFERIATA